MPTQDDLNDLNDEPPRLALLQMITGFWISQAIYVAAKLGVADLLTDGPKSTDELAKSAGVSPRELFRLLRFLASVGVFAEVEDGYFETTPLSAGLQTGVPGSLRSLAIMYGEETYRAWGDLLHSVKTSETAFNYTYKSGVFQYLAQHPESASVFNHAMTEFTVQESTAVMTAYDFSDLDRVVDVAGGQGLFIADLLKSNPNLKGVLFELPQVIKGAKGHIETAELTDRCEVIGGDFFESVPNGGNAYILKNILVNWDDERSVALLKNCHHAMVENGKLLVIEVSVISPKNVPSFGKLFDLHMLVMTGGRGRSEVEFRALFAAAGFKLTNIIPTESPVSIIEGVPI
jgi:hypothetical protein